MSEREQTSKIVGATSARLSDGTVWPLPATEAEELVWRLTYATPSRDDLRRAARIVAAYGYLLTETNRQRRDQVCRDMRAALSLNDRLAAIPAEKRDPGIEHVRQQLAKETA